MSVSDQGGPKSSFELAMERLRKKDEADGVTTTPVTDAQKSAIAEVRSVYEARLAEQDILRQSAMRARMGGDPAEIEEIGRHFGRERERLVAERDAKVEKIRRGEG